MQQGQVFELKKRAVDGRAVWAYRYRSDGPGSRRLQRGGFSSERDAAEALERALEHLRRQKGVGSTLTFRELDSNPAKHGVDNPQRRRTEKRPFESWAQLDELAGRLGPRYGPAVLFAAATGLRPGEWMALEQRDIDCQARVVYVRRAPRNGRLKSTKTEGSIRAVPLQAIALAALDQLIADRESQLLFPSHRGGYFDLHNFRNRCWKPAQIAAASCRRAASTISATRSQPSRSAPASQPSTARAIWEPA